ncbi:MAG: methionyl-tRNA formyltransferase [Clostridia bacterium]|nr:methionyl-tRNA formyltransferase [Clostridia bacterium]
MKVVFMGTPDFAAVTLKELVERGFGVCAVITQPDRVNARGNKVIPGAVKTYAESVGLPVYQPLSLRGGEGDEIFKKYSPDVAVVAAYGRILPPSLLSLPRLGCVNVHASLLPKYRGASPIQTAIVNGENVTGVTIMQLDEGMDTGDMLAVREVGIPPEMTAGELFEALAPVGAELLTETLIKLDAGEIIPIKQDESKATYAPMISKEAAVIDFTKSAASVVNLVRGLNPNPVARADIKGNKLKVYKAAVGETTVRPAGEAYEKDGSIAVACGDGIEVLLNEVQGEGGKRMDSAAYLRGHPIFNEE